MVGAGVLARSQLRRGSSVVLDGVARQPEITNCRELAKDEGASSFVVMTTCSDPDVHRSRIESRHRGIPNWYELKWAHVERALATWEPLRDVDLVVDAARPLASNVALLTASLEEALKR